jgi:LysM repeat protein
LTVPAGGAAPSANGASVAPDTGMGGETYTVKSGDSLTKIAKAHGTTVKAIESENNLSTTKIKVGQKLKIPTKVEAAAHAHGTHVAAAGCGTSAGPGSGWHACRSISTGLIAAGPALRDFEALK